MSLLEALLIGLAGLAAGTINTVVGSGTLITFPTLLAFGVPPVTANVSNTVGLVPGSLSGAIGYRAELAGQRARLLRLAVASLIGGLAGAVLLLGCRGRLRAVVPVLIGWACCWSSSGRGSRAGSRPGTRPAAGRPTTAPGGCGRAVALAGVYGGYFGAAQGVLLMAIMGIGVAETLQRLNASRTCSPCSSTVAGVLSCRRRRRLGGRRPHRGRVDRGGTDRRDGRVGGCRTRCCAVVIVVVGSPRSRCSVTG